MRNTEVEEIYGLSTDYDLKTQTCIGTDPITGDTITNRSFTAFSKELDYCVSVTTLNSDNSQKYIESYAIGDNGMYIHQSANMAGDVTTKKYRYTYEELGIESSEIVESIALGAPGLDGDPKKCLLAISTNNLVDTLDGKYTKSIVIHLYTYHLTENGVIGKMYASEKNVIENLSIIVDSYSNDGKGRADTLKLGTFNIRCNEFFGINNNGANTSNTYKGFRIYFFKLLSNIDTYGNIEHSISVIREASPTFGAINIEIGNTELIVSDDDKYITGAARCYLSSAYIPIIKVDTSLSQYRSDFLKSCGFLNDTGIVNIKNTDCVLKTDDKYLYCYDFSTSNVDRISINGGTLKLTSEKKIGEIRLTPDGKKLIALEFKSNSDHQIAIYDFEKILQTTTDNTKIKPETTFKLASGSSNYSMYSIFTNSNVSKIIAYGSSATWGMYKLENNEDLTNIIGVVYKGKKYYNISTNSLNATPSNVISGKTFIGANGYPQVGTLETGE